MNLRIARKHVVPIGEDVFELLVHGRPFVTRDVPYDAVVRLDLVDRALKRVRRAEALRRRMIGRLQEGGF